MTKRLEATPVQEVLARESMQVVGWLYRWNTGEYDVRWHGAFRGNVVYRPFQDGEIRRQDREVTGSQT